MLIYYAHCISIYDTPTEVRDIEMLEAMGFDVYNPNNPGLQELFVKRGSEDSMKACFHLVRNCDGLAFRSLPDGSIPAGVAAEIRENGDRPLIELPNMTQKRSLTVLETREYLRNCGKR